nr:MAG TPA: hypothetical protein [Caudoviricetes sp.]
MYNKKIHRIFYGFSLMTPRVPIHRMTCTEMLRHVRIFSGFQDVGLHIARQ